MKTLQDIDFDRASLIGKIGANISVLQDNIDKVPHDLQYVVQRLTTLNHEMEANFQEAIKISSAKVEALK